MSDSDELAATTPPDELSRHAWVANMIWANEQLLKERTDLRRRIRELEERPIGIIEIAEALSDQELAGLKARFLATQQSGEPLRIIERSPEPKYEYGQRYAGGGYLTFNDSPEILEIQSIATQIRYGQQFGGKVGRRRIIVVTDWEILPEGATE